jgi:hypothetical protein
VKAAEKRHSVHLTGVVIEHDEAGTRLTERPEALVFIPCGGEDIRV